MHEYEHQQFSPWPLVVMGALTLFAAQFSVLRTRVDENGVSWSFGLGFPCGFIPFGEIAGFELVRTSPSEGFGIHWTSRHGWLWNTAGRSAVMIRKRHGGTITLGSDDAEGLYQAIQSHAAHS